jgi:rhodanese-related sulfurtransferase
MNIVDFFKSPPNISVEEDRAFLKDNDPEDYFLVDVRQPKEYEEGHLPGARLIPLGNLEEHMSELDPAKPAIAY